MIVSGQMTREEALSALEEPLYDPRELAADLAFFCKKLGISEAEFHDYMVQPAHTYTDFPNWDRHRELIKKMQNAAHRIFGYELNVYS